MGASKLLQLHACSITAAPDQPAFTKQATQPLTIWTFVLDLCTPCISALQVCNNDDPLNVCCINGQYKRPNRICRYVTYHMCGKVGPQCVPSMLMLVFEVSRQLGEHMGRKGARVTSPGL